MERLKISEIDINSMERLFISSNESILYKDNDELYKMFYLIDEDDLKIKLEKLLALEKSSLPGILEIRKLIFGIDGCSKKEKLVGYSMPYIEGKTLKQFYGSVDINEFMKVLNEVSKKLEVIHNDERKIVISDFQFNNIMIDSFSNPYFIDMDSFKVGSYSTKCYSSNLALYARNRKVKPLQYISKETDKISFILSFLGMIFNDYLDNITLYDYDEKSEQIEILKDLRQSFIQLQNKEIFIPSVPYIHEVIGQNR